MIMGSRERPTPVDEPPPQPHPDPVRRAAGLIWPNLPVLILGSVLAVLPLGLARVLAPGPVGTALLGGLFLLAAAPLLRTAMVLLAGDHRGIGGLLRGLGQDLLTALPIATPPAVAAALTAVAVQLWETERLLWLIGSAAAGGAVTVILGVIMVVALPYRLHSGCSARAAWLIGLYATTRRPVPVIAVLCAAGLLGSALPAVSLALGFLALGPFALLWAAAATAVLDHGRALLDRRRP